MFLIAASLGFLMGMLVLIRAQGVSPSASYSQSDYVVLLHGAGRTAASMSRAACYLRKRGYRVINANYPSNRFSVELLSNGYLDRLLHERIADRSARIHFVTHSMGGILVRQYLSNHFLERMGRVVMLAPPNQGSQIVDCLNANWLSRSFLGRSQRRLGTGAEDLPRRLGPVGFECGVIAGDRSLNPFLSWLLPDTNDGKVTVENTRVEGMRDFLVLHSTHTWLMWRARTLRQTARFLERGQFDHKCLETE